MKLKLLPSCTQNPRTTSFRAATSTMKEENDSIFKTINSVYNFDRDGDSVETTESWFTHSSESCLSTSATTTHDQYDDSPVSIEAVIRGAQQSADQRLLFEPGPEDSPRLMIRGPNVKSLTMLSKESRQGDKERSLPPFLRSSFQASPICQDACMLTPNKYRKKKGKMEKIRGPPFWSLPTSQVTGQDVRSLTLSPSPSQSKASVMVSVDSKDPYYDFKRSMEEMVESLGVRDEWEGLEELLGLYLKANDKTNHGYIVSAFVDLLAGFVAANNNVNDDEIAIKSTTCFSSAASSLSSSASNSAQLLEDDSDHSIG